MNEKLSLLKIITYKYCSYKVYLHQNRVVEFSYELFENLKELMLLDEEEQEILLISSQIHDIGKCINKKQHHKYSMDIIKNDREINNIIGDIKEVISAITYSHRKEIYQDIFLLGEMIRNRVLSVISILRIADALDYYEDDNIKITKIYCNNKEISIKINKDFDYEAINRFNEKKRLFEKLTSINLYLKK